MVLSTLIFAAIPGLVTCSTAWKKNVLTCPPRQLCPYINKSRFSFTTGLAYYWSRGENRTATRHTDRKEQCCCCHMADCDWLTIPMKMQRKQSPMWPQQRSINGIPFGNLPAIINIAAFYSHCNNGQTAFSSTLHAYCKNNKKGSLYFFPLYSGAYLCLNVKLYATKYCLHSRVT